MKNIIASLILVTIFISTITGCKKTSDTPPDELAMLMNKDWKVIAYTVSPSLFGLSDIYAASPACTRDNTSRFLANNVFSGDEGATKCNSSDPQTITGTWSYVTSTKKLAIFDGTDHLDIDVLELNNTTLRGTIKESLAGVTYTYTITFSAP